MASSFRIGRLTALLITGLTMSPILSDAQIVGDEAELGRLQSKAEDAIGNDDADGAAMMMGRAALLVAQLRKRETGWKMATLLDNFEGAMMGYAEIGRLIYQARGH